MPFFFSKESNHRPGTLLRPLIAETAPQTLVAKVCRYSSLERKQAGPIFDIEPAFYPDKTRLVQTAACSLIHFIENPFQIESSRFLARRELDKGFDLDTFHSNFKTLGLIFIKADQAPVRNQRERQIPSNTTPHITVTPAITR